MFISRLFKALKGLSRVIKEPKCSYQGLSRRVSAHAACIKNEVEKMSSMIIMWKAMKQQQEQKRVISERTIQARTLIGGCVLIQFPRNKGA